MARLSAPRMPGIHSNAGSECWGERLDFDKGAAWPNAALSCGHGPALQRMDMAHRGAPAAAAWWPARASLRTPASCRASASSWADSADQYTVFSSQNRMVFHFSV